MPAPNEPLRAPYPNLIVPGWPRVACHVITFDGTNGAVAHNAARSSQGTGITRTGEGAYTITFPPGGTGAVGFLLDGAVEATAGDVTIPRVFQVDSDVASTSYALGALGIVSSDLAATSAVNDVLGTATVVVFVLLGPGGAI